MSSPRPKTPTVNLGLLLREPYRIANEELHRRIAESGHQAVRAPHGNVFAFLDDGGTQVSELARRAQITKQSMAELVAHLERHGYVERVPDPRRPPRHSSVAQPRSATRSTRSLARSSPSSSTASSGASAPSAWAQLRELLQEVNAE